MKPENFANDQMTTFFTQHVTDHTRNAILDLVITNEPNMVHDLEIHGNFPGSDDNVLSWKLDVTTEQSKVHREMFDYSRADVVTIRQELQATD